MSNLVWGCILALNTITFTIMAAREPSKLYRLMMVLMAALFLIGAILRLQ